MILIITHKEDFTADFVIDKLNKLEILYHRLNCEDLDKLNFRIENNTGFEFVIDNIERITSVWFRRTKLPNIEIRNEAEKFYILGEYDALLNNIYALLKNKKWLSYPKHVYEAENKLFQLKLAAELGFILPDTIVTNQHNILRNFFEKNLGNIVIKPLHQGRIKYSQNMQTIFTNKLHMDFIYRLDDFTLTPCIFQENIEKAYELRVTIVGNKVFAAKIDSQHCSETLIDWRRKQVPFTPYNLPEEITKKCIGLVSSLNLSFGAIDLIRKANGDYIFLEINPNGQWAWLETQSNLKISDEIVNFLTS
jgi:glutathione synthase/RimK-type ligase-like ATP-grasp enzyme